MSHKQQLGAIRSSVMTIQNFLSVLRKMKIIGLRYVMPRNLENKYQISLWQKYFKIIKKKLLRELGITWV